MPTSVNYLNVITSFNATKINTINTIQHIIAPMKSLTLLRELSFKTWTFWPKHDAIQMHLSSQNFCLRRRSLHRTRHRSLSNLTSVWRHNLLSSTRWRSLTLTSCAKSNIFPPEELACEPPQAVARDEGNRRCGVNGIIQ